MAKMKRKRSLSPVVKKALPQRPERDNKMTRSISPTTNFPDHDLDLDEFFNCETPQWGISYPNVKAGTDLSDSEDISLHISPFVLDVDKINDKKNCLDIHYTVHPSDAWNSLKSYNRFKIQGEDYLKKECVWVKPIDNCSNSTLNEADFWICTIVEVKARDPSHVYALVAWLYRPDELPSVFEKGSARMSGRRPYHGKSELVASNHLDVLDVTTFAGKVDVEHWLEQDEEEDQRGLYWRQTYNHKTSRISDLRKHCICNTFYNPDKLMLACPNASCEIWLHDECLLKKALTDVIEGLADEDSNGGGKAKNSKKTKKTSNVGRLGKLSAKIINRGGCPVAEITDLRLQDGDGKRVWKEKLSCLKCSTNIT